MASRIDVWPDDGYADVELRFDSGPRYELGEISQSQDFLDPQLVHAFMDLQPGTPFDRNALTQAHRSLSDSGYFGRIRLFPDFEAAADGRIPLRVELEPAARIEYTLGAGYSTDTGPRFRAGFRNNRVGERGHRLKADLNVSEVRQGITGEYRIPLDDPRSDWMSYTASVATEKTDTFESDTVAVGVRRTRRLTSTWLRTLAVDLSNDSFTVGTETDDSLLIVPSLTFDHKNADRDIYPTRGRRFTTEIAGTSDAIGSTTSFAQVTTWFRLIRTFGSRTRVIARATAGYIEADNFTQLPPSRRYFAGGDQSIRGYDLDSLGPRDELGDVIGGTRLLVGSIEIERQLRGNYYGAAFVDGGNAFNDEAFDPAVGVGLGLIWRSPVGPVRIYVGYPLDDEDASPRLHLRLGTDL
jgi:translocation and assembly module TamA